MTVPLTPHPENLLSFFLLAQMMVLVAANMLSYHFPLDLVCASVEFLVAMLEILFSPEIQNKSYVLLKVIITNDTTI